jgi:hypothetical protein
MTQFGVRSAVAAAAVLAMSVVPTFAQTRTPGTYPTHETQILRLGTSERFSMPMRNPDQLHTMVNKNRDQFNTVLSLAGLSESPARCLMPWQDPSPKRRFSRAPTWNGWR